MKAFAELYAALDATTKTNEKVAAMAEYFSTAPPADAAWAVHFLSGNRPKRLVGSRLLREWAGEAAGIPPWLFEECYGAVGDLAETVALLVPPARAESEESLLYWVEERLLPLRRLDEEGKHRALLEAWGELGQRQIFVWTKLLTGAFRVGVSKRLVVRALERVGEVDAATLSHRLMGHWRPTSEAFEALFSTDTRDADQSRPYPFFLAHPLEAEPETLGSVEDWLVEWKWDGIRAQLIRRGGGTFLWSRGEELVTESFPEVSEAAAGLPDGTVLDGELMPWRGLADEEASGGPLPFSQLQRRLGRKKPGGKILREVPVVLLTYDLLELGGEDWRQHPQRERRRRLAELVGELDSPIARRLRLSPVLEVESWEQLAAAREQAREELAEGLMLKRGEAPYGVGRKRGDWWKWKVDPHTVDAVMIYAQRGHGRRASLYTDYTFAVWDGGELVPFAKAYSGLTDEEIRRVDRFVRRNTVERFGPVRSVRPELIFELAFEGIQRSRRHKSGVAVRFPRMARWRTDKKPADADSLEQVIALLPPEEP
ncbi:MAG: ATP-dependent DNA ligase [Acidobacteriota bacterium]|nr:ATP-dependent DNA ligase [Acidobacteriota bacterium]